MSRDYVDRMLMEKITLDRRIDNLNDKIEEYERSGNGADDYDLDLMRKQLGIMSEYTVVLKERIWRSMNNDTKTKESATGENGAGE